MLPPGVTYTPISLARTSHMVPLTWKGDGSIILPHAQRGCSETFGKNADDYHRAQAWILQKNQHGLVLWQGRSDSSPKTTVAAPHSVGSAPTASFFWSSIPGRQPWEGG